MGWNLESKHLNGVAVYNQKRPSHRYHILQTAENNIFLIKISEQKRKKNLILLQASKVKQ